MKSKMPNFGEDMGRENTELTGLFPPASLESRYQNKHKRVKDQSKHQN